MIDFHNHLVPAVDDGAADLAQSREALRQMYDQGFRSLVVTPHLSGALTTRPAEMAEYLSRVDEGWERMRAAASAELPDLELHRGFEVMLDVPVPDLSDPRVRLAGTRFVLLEFPFMTVPPNVTQSLYEVRMAGYTPVVAHPERYGNLDGELRGAEEWRRIGALLQVNAGSLLGRYGARAEALSWGLLRRGLVDYLASDFHARGTCHTAEARAAIERGGGAAQAVLLTETNPSRLLRGQAPLPVPALPRPKKSLWQRVFGRRRG